LYDVVDPKTARDDKPPAEVKFEARNLDAAVDPATAGLPSRMSTAMGADRSPGRGLAATYTGKAYQGERTADAALKE
jgi:hypothetical protein